MSTRRAILAVAYIAVVAAGIYETRDIDSDTGRPIHHHRITTHYEDGSVTYDDGTSACVAPEKGCTP